MKTPFIILLIFNFLFASAQQNILEGYSYFESKATEITEFPFVFDRITFLEDVDLTKEEIIPRDIFRQLLSHLDDKNGFDRAEPSTDFKLDKLYKIKLGDKVLFFLIGTKSETNAYINKAMYSFVFSKKGELLPKSMIRLADFKFDKSINDFISFSSFIVDDTKIAFFHSETTNKNYCQLTKLQTIKNGVINELEVAQNFNSSRLNEEFKDHNISFFELPDRKPKEGQIDSNFLKISGGYIPVGVFGLRNGYALMEAAGVRTNQAQSTLLYHFKGLKKKFGEKELDSLIVSLYSSRLQMMDSSHIFEIFLQEADNAGKQANTFDKAYFHYERTHRNEDVISFLHRVDKKSKMKYLQVLRMFDEELRYYCYK